jgi:hypothetical protein
MYRTSLRDCKQCLPLLGRELSDEPNLDVNLIDQTITARAVRTIVPMDLGMRQDDLDALKRPTLACRVHAQRDRFTGS